MVEDLHTISARRSPGLSDLQCQMISSEAARFRHSLARPQMASHCQSHVRLSRCILLDKTKQNKDIKNGGNHGKLELITT